VVGADFEPDAVAKFWGGTMKLLIFIVAVQRLHDGHSDVNGEDADLSYSLREGVLDFEVQAIDTAQTPGARSSETIPEKDRYPRETKNDRPQFGTTESRLKSMAPPRRQSNRSASPSDSR
jgi:hypothetical protein